MFATQRRHERIPSQRVCIELTGTLHFQHLLSILLMILLCNFCCCFECTRMPALAR